MAAVASSNASELLVKRLNEHAVLPARGSALAAGYDLSSAHDYVLPARGKELIKTGLAVSVPAGTYGRVGTCRIYLGHVALAGGSRAPCAGLVVRQRLVRALRGSILLTLVPVSSMLTIAARWVSFYSTTRTSILPSSAAIASPS